MVLPHTKPRQLWQLVPVVMGRVLLPGENLHRSSGHLYRIQAGAPLHRRTRRPSASDDVQLLAVRAVVVAAMVVLVLVLLEGSRSWRIVRNPELPLA